MSASSHLPYRLGLPAWAFPGWRDRYFSSSRPALSEYATVFNTVEGNTTFYRIPNRDTVQSWRRSVEERDFRFCFKLPRSVTHERRPALDDLQAFIRSVEPLEGAMGPLLLQFPARVGPNQLPLIESIVQHLPEHWTGALEVRHPAFFSEPQQLEPLLQKFALGRVMLDTRALYAGDPSHPDVVKARHEKPDLPVLETVYNDLAFIRLVLHPEWASNEVYVKDWATKAAGYLGHGQQVFMMMHCPNNLHCPEQALTFHRELGRHLDLPELPAWPLPQQQMLL